MPCAESGISTFLRGLPLLLEIGANQQKAGHFTLRAGGRLQRNGVHAGDFEQALFEQAQNLQASLREFLRLIRMFGCDAVEPRDEFIYARIVLHGAGTERIHAQVDRVVPRREPREVANHLDLADFGKSFDAVAAVARAQGFRGSAAGTSSGGSSNARFPGDDFSKISPSFWLVWRVAFLIWSFMVSGRLQWARHAVPAKSLSDGCSRARAQCGRKAFDFRAWSRFRHADQRVLRQFGIRRCPKQAGR